MPKKGQGKKQLAKQNKIINAKEKDAVASESVDETTIDSTLSKWKSKSSSKSKIDLNNKNKSSSLKNLEEESESLKEQNPLEVLRRREAKSMEKDKEENKDHGMLKDLNMESEDLKKIYWTIFNVPDINSEWVAGFSNSKFKESMDELLNLLANNDTDNEKIQMNTDTLDDISYEQFMTDVNIEVSKLSDNNKFVEMYEINWSKRRRKSLNSTKVKTNNKEKEFYWNENSESIEGLDENDELMEDQTKIKDQIDKMFDLSCNEDSLFKKYYKEQITLWFTR